MDIITDDTPREGDLVYPPLDWAPTEAQLPLWLDLMAGVPNIIAITHRQLGKDELFMKSCCLEAMDVAANYVYCLPETEHLRKVLYKAVNPLTGISRIDEAFPMAIRIKKLDNEMIIELPELDAEGKETGKKSLVQFVGSDNHKALRGMVARIYYFSEWAFCDPHSLSVIRPIVERNGGKLRFFTTAFGENHAYKMLVKNRDKPDWACHLITNNTTHPLVHDEKGVGIKHGQSGQVPPNRMAVILEENVDMYGPEIGQALTDQEYECSFQVVAAGSYYLDLILKAERAGRVGSLPHRPDLPVYAAFDLGFTDAMAIWYVQVTESGWLHVIEYDEIHKTSIPELIPMMKEKKWIYASVLLPHDGAHSEVTSGTTTEKLFKAAQFDVRVMPQTDDAQQIPSVRTLIPRCKFGSTDGVKRGLQCLRHFHNKKKEEGGQISWSPKPVHDWSSHAAKSLATLAYFSPQLQSGVQPPKQIVKDLFAPSASYQGAGWMR